MNRQRGKPGERKSEENVSRLLALPPPSPLFLPNCSVKNGREIGVETERKLSSWLLERIRFSGTLVNYCVMFHVNSDLGGCRDV